MSRRWEPIKLFRWWELRDEEACYVIIRNGRVLYIGQTFLLKTRMTKHNCRSGYGNDFQTPWVSNLKTCKIKVFRPKKFGESLMVEARLIRKLKPEFNQKGKTWGRAATA